MDKNFIASELLKAAKEVTGGPYSKGPYTTSGSRRDRKLRQLEEAANEANESLNFKYDMGLPGGIRQADKALKRAIEELTTYKESMTASSRSARGAELDLIIEALDNTSALMSVGKEFDRLGVKYEINLPDPPIPPHVIAHVGRQKFTLVNKKYAAGRPDYVKGQIAVYED